MTNKSLALPNIPGLPGVQAKIQNANGDIVELNSGYNLLDLKPLGEFPRIWNIVAGQADEKRPGKEKAQVKKYSNQIFAIKTEKVTSEDGSTTTDETSFTEPLGESIRVYPLDFDMYRRLWVGTYDAANPAEPDCKSDRYLVLPQPDEKFINKFSHMCMGLDANGNIKPICPFAQWSSDAAGKRIKPKCTEFIGIYVAFHPDPTDDILEVGIIQFKSSAYKSGEKLARVIQNIKRSGASVYNAEIEVLHGDASQDQTGKTLYGKFSNESYTGEQDLESLADQASSMIASRRDFASRKPDGDTAIPQEQAIDGEIVEDNSVPF